MLVRDNDAEFIARKIMHVASAVEFSHDHVDERSRSLSSSEIRNVQLKGKIYNI